MPALSVRAPVDGVIVAELDNPPRNLWTSELCQQLAALLDMPPPSAHVLVLRSSGDVFCLGRERAGRTTGELRSEASMLVAFTRAFRRTRLVTVAEVHGDAAGFGVGVVAASDVAVAAADARFSFPEVGIGLAPALVLAWLPRVVGEREAFWLTATGEEISAARARELGLLNAVAPTVQELRLDVDKRVKVLRRNKPRVHAEIRDMLRVMSQLSADSALDLSIDRLVSGFQRRDDD